jgi:hypothetical protein
MKMKHTKGPWVKEKVEIGYQVEDGVNEFYKIKQNGTTIAHVYHNFKEWEDYEKDAQLIAAAPDLLWALMEVVGEWDHRHRDENHQIGITPEPFGISEARRIIRKATE